MDPSMSMSEQMRRWSEDFINKIQALEEENTTLKSKIVELENKEKMSNSSEDPPRNEVRAKSGMNGSLVSISSDGVDSGIKEIHVKEEQVDEFIPDGDGESDNLQTETPSMDDDEIDIKEEDVGYGSRKSKSDVDNSLHDPALPALPRNVDQSSQIPIENETDKSIQRMFSSTEQVSNTDNEPHPASELGASGSRDLVLKKGLDTRSACESNISAVSNAPSSENSDSDSEDTDFSTNSRADSSDSSESSDSDNIHGHLSSSPRKRKTADCKSPTNTSFLTDVDEPLSYENSKKTQGLPPKKKKIQASNCTSDLKGQGTDTCIPDKETKGSSGVPRFGKTTIERVIFEPPPPMAREMAVFGQKTKSGRSVTSGVPDFSALCKNKRHISVSQSSQKMILRVAVDTETPNANLTPTASSTRSVSETAKIRKNNLVNGINQGLGEDVTETLSSGVSPALLNDVSHPSVFIPDKTNYLKAGLFSKYYKTLVEGAPIPGQGSMQREGCEGGQMTIPGGILPQPAYSSDYVTVRGMDFVLPYDIWCFGVLQARDKDHYEEWKREQDALKAQKKIQRRQRILDAKGKSD